jgi:hypothetical protein
MKIKPATRTRSGLLVCRYCGKLTDCRIDNYLRFIREGWPICCGEVMAQYRSVEQQSAKGQTAETPLEGTRI